MYGYIKEPTEYRGFYYTLFVVCYIGGRQVVKYL